jgi:adenylate cyclase class 2
MGPVETEVKLRVAGPVEAREALGRAGASLARSRHFEDNVLFDDGARSLASRGELLRLRRTGEGGTLTFKGPRTVQGGIKSRPELEVDVPDADALERILLALGYRPVFRYQKYREVYTLRGAEVVLDETPIGTFLEIEGGEEQIHKASEALGREESEFISDSYAALFFASGGSGDMVFR